MSQPTAVDVEAPISGTTSTWPADQIRNFASIGTGAKDTQDRNQTGRYPFFVRSQKIERIDSWSFDGEAVLTAGDGVGTGKVFHYINGRFDYHQRVYRISNFRSDVSGKYFFYQFSRNFLARIESLTAKSSVDSVRMETIAGMEIPLPPRIEQDRIVDAIDDAQALIMTLERLIAKKQLVKQGMMQQLLTGKTRLPGFRGEWRKVRFANLGRCIRGVAYNPDLDLAPTATSETIELLRSNNIKDSQIILNNVQHVQRRRVKDDQLLKLDDIMICMANGSKQLVGKAARFSQKGPIQFTFGAFMAAFRVYPSVANPPYVYYCFQTKAFRDWIGMILAGSSINNLRPRDIEGYAMELPDLEEQKAIANSLIDADAEIDALVRRLDQARLIKNGMMQELLTGRTRLDLGIESKLGGNES